MHRNQAAGFVERLYNIVWEWTFRTVDAVLLQLLLATGPDNDTILGGQDRMVLAPA